ncbi:hypothetical protein [Streptomyces sp. NPDC048277]|uniref:hypothetical protein n=1 Tax=Streptomyces sp. NPDC048277 TaxID=3155027 RepID=UPI0033CFF1A0
MASDSPSTAAKSEAGRTASTGSSPTVEIRTPGPADSRNRAPAATHQPYDRRPLAALALDTTTAYRRLLAGDACSFAATAILTLRCGEPPSPSRTVADSHRPDLRNSASPDPRPAAAPLIVSGAGYCE